MIIGVNPKEGKLIFSEKGNIKEEKKEIATKYSVGDILDCEVSGIVDFGVFLRIENNLEGLARTASAINKTAGGLFRDVRNANMALSEARLEGGFARKETEDELIKEYKKTHKGMMPDEKILDGIKKEASKASADAIFANTLLIWIRCSCHLNCYWS